MQEWLNYWNFIFWFVFIGFLFNHTNLIMLVFFSEFMWILLYGLAVLIGIYLDDLNATSLSFLILGIAGLEFSFGFLILLLFKNTNNSFYLNKKDLATQNKYTTSLNKIVYNQINF